MKLERCMLTLIACLAAVSEIMAHFRPVIGIMSQELSQTFEKMYAPEFDSYIAASYVKFLESSGSRVVPIQIGKPKEYYEKLMSQLNGVLFPGGSVNFTMPLGYAKSGEHVWKIASKMNDKGQYFPLWGTGIGMELFSYYSANNSEHRERCDANFKTMSLILSDDAAESKLYGDITDDIITILTSQAVTVNNHKFCIIGSTFEEMELNEIWKINSFNVDPVTKKSFLSSLEHKKYPFYGISFHPEKNAFEWVEGKNIPHTANAILATQYFSNFFVNQCRKNDNKFPDKIMENDHLIQNFNPFFTGKDAGSNFIQSYLFQSTTEDDGK